MAKVIYGGGITSIRGKLGGNIYSRNKYGNIIRPFANPIQPNSAKQMIFRERFQINSANWRLLLPQAQDAWRKASILLPDSSGEMKSISGYPLFMMLNNNLANIGHPAISTPPVDKEVSAKFDTLQIDCSGAVEGPPARFSIKIAFGPTPWATGSCVLVKASNLVTMGTMTMKGKTRIISCISPTGTSPCDITSNWESTYGVQPAPTEPEHAQIYFHIQIIDIQTGIATKGYTCMCQYGGTASLV